MDRIPRHTIISIAAAMIISGCGQPAPKQTNPAASRTPFTPAGDTAAKEITTDFLRDQIARISSDEFEGRGPASAGDRRTRAYLIEQLKSLGYQPGGGAGQWEQPFDIVGITPQMPKQWVFR